MSEHAELLIYNGDYNTKIIENGKIVNAIYINDLIVSKEYEIRIRLQMNLNLQQQYTIVVNGLTMDNEDYQIYFDESYFSFNTNFREDVIERLQRANLDNKLTRTSVAKDIYNRVSQIESQLRKDCEAKYQAEYQSFVKLSVEEKKNIIEKKKQELNEEKQKQFSIVPLQQMAMRLFKEYDGLIANGKENEIDSIYQRYVEIQTKLENAKRIIWLNEKAEKEFVIRLKVFKPSTTVQMKLTFNCFNEKLLNKMEFSQMELNIIGETSSVIDSSFLNRENQDKMNNHFISLKQKKQEDYQYALFDTGKSKEYYTRIIQPFFMNKSNKQYFIEYFGNSDVVEEKKSYFMFKPMKTLEKYISSPDAKMQLIDIISCTLEICKALKLLHQQGIVHNHLNDQTILVEKVNKRHHFKLWSLTHIYLAGQNKSLFDFACEKTPSKITFDKNAITCFSSPEMKKNESIDVLSDTYSIGILLLYLLFVGSGKPVSQFEGFIGELEKVGDDQKLAKIEEKKLRCPQAMNNLIMNCLVEKGKRCSLADGDNAIIPTLEKMRLQFLL